MGFTKLDSGIIDSSLWDEHSDVLKVFEAFWTKSDPDGIVNATYNAMFRAANLCDRYKRPLPMCDFEFALNVLLAPDPNSRTKEHEGRRIVRLEESKWLIVTYKDRREYTYSNNPEAIRKREYRNGTSRDMSQSVPGHSASVSASDSVSKSLEECRETFLKEVNAFTPTYPAAMLSDFIDYWTEKNQTGKKMRFQMEKTWDTHKRLARWARNNKNFSGQTQQSQTKTVDSGRYRTI